MKTLSAGVPPDPMTGLGRSGREGDDQDAIKRLFSPEFRNRLDSIIAYAALTPEIVGRVVEKFKNYGPKSKPTAPKKAAAKAKPAAKKTAKRKK